MYLLYKVFQLQTKQEAGKNKKQEVSTLLFLRYNKKWLEKHDPFHITHKYWIIITLLPLWKASVLSLNNLKGPKWNYKLREFEN